MNAISLFFLGKPLGVILVAIMGTAFGNVLKTTLPAKSGTLSRPSDAGDSAAVTVRVSFSGYIDVCSGSKVAHGNPAC